MINSKTTYILIPSGEYTVGVNPLSAEKVIQNSNDNFLKKEYIYTCTPELNVILKEFEIAERPVTLFEFTDFIKETGYKTEAEVDGWGWLYTDRWFKSPGVSWNNPFGTNADLLYHKYGHVLPVLQVSWNDAVEFCKWKSEKDNTLCRLPYEHEWEVFALLNGGAKMESLDRIEQTSFSNNYEYIKVLSEQVRKNFIVRFGLVWEWVSDWFAGYRGSPDNKDFGRV